MVTELIKSMKQFGKDFTYFILGTVLLAAIPIYILLSFPIYLYRWVLCHVLAPLCRGDSGKAVTARSSFFAHELAHEKSRTRPRCAIVCKTAFQGNVKFDELKDIIHRKWITAEKPTGSGLLFPELQQYVESWLGYLFWAQDKDFNLDNHLTHHNCQDTWTEAMCEQFFCSVVEDLLNKPFPKGRSPWEVHLINGYRNSELLAGSQEISVVVFRFHHSLADGFSIMTLIFEGMLGIPLSECHIATPGSSNMRNDIQNSSMKILNFASTIPKLLSFPVRVSRDIGYSVYKLLIPTRTPWYVPEEGRSGRQLYGRSGLIPITRIKLIKTKFGVSFAAVLLSSIGAAIARTFKSKGFHNQIRTLPFLAILPLKGHPGKLTNHWSAAVYEIPIDQCLNHLQRLKESEEQLQKVKRSTIPTVTPIFLKSFGLLPPFISKRILTNRTLSTGFSNIPGPGVELQGRNGWDLIAKDSIVGLIFGVGGVGFIVESYHDQIRIEVAAEKAVMDRAELADLIKAVSQEIDTLHELTREDEHAEFNVTEEGVMLDVK